jgi:hypothetical protein
VGEGGVPLLPRHRRVRRRKGFRRGRTTAGHSMPLAQPLARARTGIKGARSPTSALTPHPRPGGAPACPAAPVHLRIASSGSARALKGLAGRGTTAAPFAPSRAPSPRAYKYKRRGRSPTSAPTPSHRPGRSRPRPPAPRNANRSRGAMVPATIARTVASPWLTSRRWAARG